MSKHTTLLEIPWDTMGTFETRLNRFAALVTLDDDPYTRLKVHVHDPGRLSELLYTGNRVLLKFAPAPHRVTDWDMIAARTQGQWVLVNTVYHRAISEALIINPSISPFGPVAAVKAEVPVFHSKTDSAGKVVLNSTGKKSRLDFKLRTTAGETVWVEVKGCTLAEDGVALFPDAPTIRGKKHLETLIALGEKGFRSALLVLVFRHDTRCFSPHTDRDPAFSSVFCQALEAGVEVYPVLLAYRHGMIEYRGTVPVCKHLFK